MRRLVQLCLVLVCSFVGREAVAAPIFDFSGRISDGKLYSIEMNDNGVVKLTSPKCDPWLFYGMVAVGDKQFTMAQLTDRELQINEDAKQAVFSGKLKANGQEVLVKYELLLNSADKVVICISGDAAAKAELKIAAVQDSARLKSKDVQVDGGEVISFASSKDGLYSGPAKGVTFCPEVPPRKLVVKPLVGKSMVLLADAKLAGQGPHGGLVVASKNGVVKLQVDKNTETQANNSPDTYGGVDFWKHNKLKMPNYNLSRNLVQNPSFEQGFKYWTYGPLGKTIDMSQGEFYSISTDNPHSGSRCVRLRGDAKQSPSKLATFATPTEKNQEYTISFYARADKTCSLTFMVWYERWGGDLFNWQGVKVTSTDWKRYSFTFKSKFSCMAFGMGISNQGANVWIDDVQLEKGTLTDFHMKPNGVCLVTDQRGNLVEPGGGRNSFFRLSGKPGSEIEHRYKVEDIFAKTVFSGKTKARLDNTGVARIPVDWVSKLPSGIYTVESNLSAEGAADLRDFDRVAVMKSAAKTPTKYPVFFADNIGSRFPNWDFRLPRLKAFGIDTILNFSIPAYDTDKNNFKKAVREAGLYQVGCLSSDGLDNAWKHRTIKEPRKDISLETIEQHAFNVAKKHADIRAWKTINEPHTLPNEEDMKIMVKYVEMLSKGAKKVNPKNLVITPDPSNMYPQYGTRYIDLFLKYGGGEFCDIMGIHPYRGRPEEPDLDKDIDSFLKMLDRHKVKKDVWFTEGIYHCNYVLPPYKLNSHRGCSSDHFRTGNFSYHIGWGEKISFAYTMRSWIMALKYGDRVKMSVDWVFGQYCVLDHELTPMVKAFSPNAVKHLLCMADYKNDLGFGRDVRGYMFEDDQTRPVAVVWTYNYLIDAGQEKGLDLDISSLPKEIEIIDCFGAAVERRQDNILTLNSFPVFVRGKAGSLKQLNAAFNRTAIVSEGFKQSFMSVKSLDLNEREFSLKNMIPNREIKGQLKLFVGGKQIVDEKIIVKGGKTWKRRLQIPAKSSRVQIAEIKAEFLPENAKKPELFTASSESLAAIRAKNAINIDGRLSDWPSGSMVSLEPRYKSFMPYVSDQQKKKELKEKYPKGIAWKGEKDLSGKLYLAWDPQNLYIAFEVKDDTLEPTDKLVSAWMGDSIQIYFDGWADATSKYTKGFDINDQVFDVWPHGNKVTLRRAVAPEQQLGFLKTGVVEKARTAFRKTADGYVIEMAMPAKDVFPVKLYKGSVFGFAAIINDSDVGFRHQGLTTTPNGTEPFLNPHLYPTVILK